MATESDRGWQQHSSGSKRRAPSTTGSFVGLPSLPLQSRSPQHGQTRTRTPRARSTSVHITPWNQPESWPAPISSRPMGVASHVHISHRHPTPWIQLTEQQHICLCFVLGSDTDGPHACFHHRTRKDSDIHSSQDLQQGTAMDSEPELLLTSS